MPNTGKGLSQPLRSRNLSVSIRGLHKLLRESTSFGFVRKPVKEVKHQARFQNYPLSTIFSFNYFNDFVASLKFEFTLPKISRFNGL